LPYPSKAIDLRDLNAGDLGQWVVVEHHPWGIEVELLEDRETRGSIDIPYLRDLVPEDRLDGPEDFPAIGEELQARVRVRWPDGSLHLTARAGDEL
jgi:hypothetical protein